MYDAQLIEVKAELVTGPCEFLVMYDKRIWKKEVMIVTGPCEFLVMYDFFFISDGSR